MKEFKISHLIKSEDLNHHGTLFAGRTAEWLVELWCFVREYGILYKLMCKYILNRLMVH